MALEERKGDRFPLDRPGRCGRRFADLVRGACTVVTARGRRLPGVDLVVAADLPARRGLASSAAYLVAVLRALYATAGAETPTPSELADLVAEIERDFGGVPCGAMDPIACAVGAIGKPLLLDCSTLAYQVLAWPDDLETIAHDTGIERDLDATPYAERRRELLQGLVALQRRQPALRALSELDVASFATAESLITEPARSRVRHVVTEIARVRAAALAIQAGDGATLGRLLDEGHQSLSNDFGASTPEIDALAAELRRHPDVLGVRLQGAGWGGSLVVLRKKPPAT